MRNLGQITKSFLILILGILPSVLFAGQFDYWQQEVNYKINVKLDDEKHFLMGDIEIEYVNNSPQPLEFIYIHLWPNAYKNLNTAYAIQKKENGDLEFHDSDIEERGYIDSLNFKIDKATAKHVPDPQHVDIVKLVLNKPLESGKKCVITTPFRVKLPKTFSRLGHIGQDYQISQWYPKPAVYDHKGWHKMPYLDQGEFYSDFGSFDVTIDLPSNYVVGATGKLQNKEELEWLNKEAEATESLLDRGVQYNDDFLKRSGRKKLRYTQEKVHDFAWFASKKYKVRKKIAELESGKKVTVWSLFLKDDLSVWRQVNDYASDALIKFSKWVGDYPYDNCVVVEGPLYAGGGMEYPMVTIISSEILKPRYLDEVVAHEVGHNWFQGILASNERVHPWLDEGVNSFYERRYMIEKYGEDMSMPKEISKLFGAEEMDLRSLAYLIQVNRLKAQPIGLHSEKFTAANYGIMVYMTTPIMLEALEAYMGRDEFDVLMQKYFSEWKFKHPHPEDFESVLESSGKNLDWFFNDIIQTSDNVDYKLVKKLKQEKTIGGISYATLRVKNKGFVSSPFTVSGIKGDSVIKTTWYDGFNGELDLLFMDGDYDFYMVDAPKYFPDVNRRNNVLKTKGMFKKIPNLRFQPGFSLKNKEKAEVLYMPAVLWNSYDKLMLGASIYNGFLFQETVEYGITPLYALGSKQLVGSARFGFNFIALSSLSIKNVNVNFSATKFSYFNHENLGNLNYNRLITTTRFNFREKNLRDKKRSYVELRTAIINKEYGKKYTTYYDKLDIWEKKNLNYNLVDFHYVIEQKQVLKDYKLDMRLEAGEGLLKTNLTYNTLLRFSEKSKMNVRLFAGCFLYNDNNTAVDYRYRMSGYQGKNDYWFDNMYLGRSESGGIFSQQLYMNDGGFKVFSPVGQTDKWLVSANIEMNPPWKLPIKIYGDIGTYDNAGYIIQGQTDWIVYDFGLTLKLPFMSVYWPLIMSPDIKRAVELNNTTYFQRISFFFDLSGLNPYKLRHRVDI